MPAIGKVEVDSLFTEVKVGQVYLGIDPGASGGLAVLGLLPVADSIAHAITMPVTERDIWNWFNRWSNRKIHQAIAVIERVHAMPGNGVSGMFKFGKSYGFLRACLIASGVPFEEVDARTWQKSLGITPKKPHTKTVKHIITQGKRKGQVVEKGVGGETDTQFKNRLKAKAQQLFPQEKVTLATADALLLAEYCRRKRQGILG